MVDEFVQVWAHKNLYVAAASIIPTPLGVNPSLTVAALALRVAHRVGERHYP